MKKTNNEIVNLGISSLTTREKYALLGTAAGLYLITLLTVVKNDYSFSFGSFTLMPQSS